MAVTERGQAAMDEFGFKLVELDQVGAPTPGRIADRLSDIESDLENAIRAGDMGAIVEAVATLRRLRGALDAWDFGMLPPAAAAD